MRGMRIMLADADAEAAQKLKNYIKLASPGAKLFLAPSSAADFLRALGEVSPGLVFADVRYFGVNPSAALRAARSRSPDTRYIVYGTYDDAEYIESVMDFGVIDYMYKPARQADVARAIRRGEEEVARIERERLGEARLSAAYEADLPIMRDRFLANLFEGALRDPDEIARSLEYFGVALAPPCRAAILKADHFRDIAAELPEREKHMVIYQAYGAALESVEKGRGVVRIGNFNKLEILLSGYTLAGAVKLLDGIKLAALRRTGRELTCGIGREYARAADITVSFREASAALGYRVLVGYGATIPIEFVELDNRLTHRYPEEKERSLVAAAVVGEYEYCARIIGQIADVLGGAGGIPENLLPKAAMTIVIAVNRRASEYGLPLDGFKDIFPTAGIFGIKSVEGFKAYLEDSFRGFCGFARGARGVVQAEWSRYMKELRNS
ncbi:MAG: hypothetical protein LBK41_03835 [Clostridiales bacterium]|jgi:two-component system response regulator YesN|nr:hypothetical protein [Clostridiales bacterium]